MNLLLRGVLDLLYPPRCEVCGRLRQDPICQDCFDQIEFIHHPVCEICGEPFDPHAHGAPRCERCRRGRRSFTVSRSAAYYYGPLADAIARFKYDGQVVLARPLGRIVTDGLSGVGRDLGADTMDVVCAVPLHISRQRERGFNQSQLLAEAIAEKLGKPLRLLLERARPTLPQVDLPASSRAANVRDAFAPRLSEPIAGQRVLLVDDLFTTGATFSECARALHRAQAAEVRCFSLARPLPRWRTPAQGEADEKTHKR